MKHIVMPDQRAAITRRELVSGLLMLSAAAVAVARKPNVELNYLGNHKLEDVIPTQIGGWKFVTNSGLVVPPEDQLQQALYSQLLTRIYDNGSGTPIMLLVAYSASETGFLQVHRPEFCYTAAGYDLSNFGMRDVPLHQSQQLLVNSLTATRNDMPERLFYWTRIGDHIPHSWAQQRLVFAKDNLRRVIPDAVLVRISTVSPDQTIAEKSLDEFIRAMIDGISPSMRRVFVV
jgi:EpsI family protein